MKEDVKKAVFQWIKKAEEDLKIVQILLEREDAAEITSSIGFHCQQAIEKYLKAFLIFHETDFRKTHDLNKLRDKCSEKQSDFSRLDFGNLIDFAVDYRYPDDAYIPELVEIYQYRDLVIEVKALIKIL